MPLLFASFRSLRQAQRPSLSGQKNKIQNFGNVQNFGFSFFSDHSQLNQRTDQFHQYVLTNGRGKIKWLILVTCKISHLPFFPCRHILSNIQKITCIILRNLFGLDLFSHQSCATGTLLLQKKIYPRKSSLNLKQLIFFMFLIVASWGDNMLIYRISE